MIRAICSLLILCNLGCSTWERERPVGVPEKAIWKGGVDGGAWVEFISVTPTTINATIFYENGEVWQRGIFKKIGDCDINPSNIVKEIVAFDGDQLLTNKSCSFVK